jgi:hypothetical protein
VPILATLWRTIGRLVEGGVPILTTHRRAIGRLVRRWRAGFGDAETDDWSSFVQRMSSSVRRMSSSARRIGVVCATDEGVVWCCVCRDISTSPSVLVVCVTEGVAWCPVACMPPPAGAWSPLACAEPPAGVGSSILEVRESRLVVGSWLVARGSWSGVLADGLARGRCVCSSAMSVLVCDVCATEGVAWCPVACMPPPAGAWSPLACAEPPAGVGSSIFQEVLQVWSGSWLLALGSWLLALGSWLSALGSRHVVWRISRCVSLSA